MARVTRTTCLKAVSLAVALASLTINYGLIDLIDGYTGYIDQARNQVLDAGWGLVFGVILRLGLLAQLRRPERRIAGIQQTALVAFALAVAGAAGEAWWYLALAAGITGACAVLVALHPARRTFLERGERLDPVMLALAGVPARPASRAARRPAHHRLAHSGDECFDRSRRVGDLVRAHVGVGSRERRPCMGVDGHRLGGLDLLGHGLAAKAFTTGHLRSEQERLRDTRPGRSMVGTRTVKE